MKAVWLLGAVVGFGGLCAGANGAIVYLSQQRSVSANGFVGGSPEGSPPLRAVGFEDFNQTRMHTFSQGVGSAIATQNSSLRPNVIVVEESARVSTIGFAADLEGDAKSLFQVTFALDAPSEYQVAHSHVSSGAPGVRRTYTKLVGPSGLVFEWLDDAGVMSTWPSSPISGILPTGQYVLQIDSAVSRSTSTGFLGVTDASTMFAMHIPTPGAATVPLFLLLAHRRRGR